MPTLSLQARDEADMPERASERVLLVGGAGFIGHHLAVELAQHGITTKIVDNLIVNNWIDNEYSNSLSDFKRSLYQGFLSERFELLRNNGVSLANVDARNEIDLFHAVEEFQPTQILHMAAISSALNAKDQPGNALDFQITTLRNLCEVVRLYNNKSGKCKQVLFMSSSTIYGDFTGIAVDESTPVNPRGIYPISKLMGEKMLKAYVDDGHIPSVTSIRPSALYGLRCISRRVSQKFIEQALVGEPLILEGGGDATLDFTDVRDLCMGIRLAIEKYGQDGQIRTYNLTYGNARTIKALSEIVAKVIPGIKTVIKPRVVEKPIRGTLLCDLARRELGYAPQYSIDNGFLEYCEWYVERWEDIKRQNMPKATRSKGAGA